MARDYFALSQALPLNFHLLPAGGATAFARFYAHARSSTEMMMSAHAPPRE